MLWNTTIKSVLVLGTVVQSINAMESDEKNEKTGVIWDEIIQTSLNRDLDVFASNTAFIPQSLNSNDLKKLIDRHGVLRYPSGDTVFLGSINPDTGIACTLSDTIVIKSLYEQYNGYICATRLEQKRLFKVENLDFTINSSDATQEDFQSELEKKRAQKVPKTLSDIKIKTGFDLEPVEKSVDFHNVKYLQCCIQSYRLHQNGTNPEDVSIGHIFLVHFNTLSGMDKNVMSKVHKLLRSMMHNISFVACSDETID